MKKVVLLFALMIMFSSVIAQKKGVKAVEKKSDTTKLALTPHNIQILSGLVKRANGLRSQLTPIQMQLNLVDSTFNSILETKLDAAGKDPKKGRWGIVGNDLIYIPNDTSTLKLNSADSANTVKLK